MVTHFTYCVIKVKGIGFLDNVYVSFYLHLGQCCGEFNCCSYYKYYKMWCKRELLFIYISEYSLFLSYLNFNSKNVYFNGSLIGGGF